MEKQHNGGNTMIKKDYSGLFWKFIGATLVCSLIPLLLVGWGIYLHYADFSREQLLESFERQISHQRQVIEMFLKQRSAKLNLVAQTHDRTYLSDPLNLVKVLKILNQETGDSVTDLGIIDQDGNHLAYIGPYDLKNKNYKDTFWFKEVMQKGRFVSDMFMGFRKVPHFIIAVTREEQGEKWVLRATIDTERFRTLVENVKIGLTGEVYLLNSEGVFQTSTRFSGKIMEKTIFPLGADHEGFKMGILENGVTPSDKSVRQVVAQEWLSYPRWMLVVKQDFQEAFKTVNRANQLVLLFLHLSAFIILVVSVFITRYMIRIIQRRDTQAAYLNQQLMQTGKLASIGELSAGVAHEINNPLAIISTEKQILIDLADQTKAIGPEFMTALRESLDQVGIQISRCKRITHNLLKFARRTKPLIEPVNLNAFLMEVIDLMEKDVRSNGIRFITELDADQPTILSDLSQLQQVFLNLITNAIDAHEGRSSGSIHIRTELKENHQGVDVVFKDTGCGIAPDALDKIFDPFFTTKPVGKGTGLGLSISFSIVKALGGKLDVQSQVGIGTEFRIFLPFNPPLDLKKSIEGNQE